MPIRRARIQRASAPSTAAHTAAIEQQPAAPNPAAAISAAPQSHTPQSQPARLKIRSPATQQIERQAQQLLLDARARAHAIVGAAEQQADTICQQATSAGEQDGRARLAAEHLALNRERQRFEATQLSGATEIAGLLAERLLGAELELNPDAVNQLAKEVLRGARSARSITLHVHELDLPVLAGRKNELGIDDADLELKEDRDLARGEVIVESELGLLDGRFSVQLERLLEHLNGDPAGNLT